MLSVLRLTSLLPDRMQHWPLSICHLVSFNGNGFSLWLVLRDTRVGYYETQWPRAGLPLFGSFRWLALQAIHMPTLNRHRKYPAQRQKHKRSLLIMSAEKGSMQTDEIIGLDVRHKRMGRGRGGATGRVCLYHCFWGKWTEITFFVYLGEMREPEWRWLKASRAECVLCSFVGVEEWGVSHFPDSKDKFSSYTERREERAVRGRHVLRQKNVLALQNQLGKRSKSWPIAGCLTCILCEGRGELNIVQ